MINNLKLENFKSHRKTEIDLKNLTVFCGQNGVGKSSIIQSLLLLRQTNLDNKALRGRLNLRGRLCDIGQKKDALYISNQGEFFEKIVFKLSEKTTRYEWIFDASKNRNYLELLDGSKNYDYENLALFQNNFQYISAYRGSDYIKSIDYEVIEGKQISYNEGKGDMTAHFLYEYGDSIIVIDELIHKEQSEFKFLKEQVSAWESEISQGVEVKAEKVTDDQYDIKYKFKVSSFEMPDHIFSSKNVGFGLSYTLPIIVAILSARPGALIIIENPEAHLHPKGIAKLTELICLGAQAGIQIILETHSDHIINGILVQCKKYENGENGIDNSNVSIYQFERNEKEHCTVATKIIIEDGVRIREAPEHFFDQIQNDLEQILGF